MTSIIRFVWLVTMVTGVYQQWTHPLESGKILQSFSQRIFSKNYRYSCLSSGAFRISWRGCQLLKGCQTIIWPVLFQKLNKNVRILKIFKIIFAAPLYLIQDKEHNWQTSISVYLLLTLSCIQLPAFFIQTKLIVNRLEKTLKH